MSVRGRTFEKAACLSSQQAGCSSTANVKAYWSSSVAYERVNRKCGACAAEEQQTGETNTERVPVHLCHALRTSDKPLGFMGETARTVSGRTTLTCEVFSSRPRRAREQVKLRQSGLHRQVSRKTSFASSMVPRMRSRLRRMPHPATHCRPQATHLGSGFPICLLSIITSVLRVKRSGDH